MWRFHIPWYSFFVTKRVPRTIFPTNSCQTLFFSRVDIYADPVCFSNHNCFFFLSGMGLGSAASAAIGGAVLTLQAGMVSAGVVAIPISLTALLAIWTYVYLRPKIRSCIRRDRAKSS